MKRLAQYFLMALLLWPAGLMAEDVVFQAQAPKQVIIGRPFQLTYSVNQRAKDLRAPEFEGFDLLAGPYTAQSRSTNIINGQRTSTFTQTYTYTLMAQKEGSFTIGPATIVVDKERYNSNGVRITVLPEDNNGQGQQGNGRQPSTEERVAQANATSSENIFVRTIVTKTRVCEQEALTLTYKLYFAGVDVAQLTNNTKLPDFTGFLRQDIDLGERQTELEHYNGRNYQTFTLYQTLLYPQHSGDIEIEPARFEAVLRVQTRGQVRSVFDDFFGSYTNVTKALTAPAQTIHVEALPAGKPKTYSGGVGKFTMTSSLSQSEVNANDAITLKIDIKGNGNMKLLKTPAVDWPEGFETYDPKVSNNYKTTASGMSGTKSIEYLAIPRAGGDYTIPALQFTYYDTEEHAYKTLQTEEYSLHVHRTAGSEQEGNASVQSYNQVQREEIRELGTDIRYIHSGELQPVRHSALDKLTFGSLAMWMWLLIPTLLAIIILLLLHKQIRENSDMARVRYKKANKVAQKRLKTAKKCMEAGENSRFYEEIEKAAWTYLSDRLSIPTADLSKDNISEILRHKGVSEILIGEVKEVLQKAEFARYAPSAAGRTQDLYEAATKMIDDLEGEKI